jgi:hypothetical protein
MIRIAMRSAMRRDRLGMRAMLLAADAVTRCLRGTWRLMSIGPAALPELDLTRQGLTRSCLAAILTVPALIAVLAAENLMAGLANASGLFQSLPLVVAVLVSQVAAFVMAPLLIAGLAPHMLRAPAFASFVIAWNWTEVLSSGLLAVPALIYAIGWSTPVIASMQWLAFAAIVARLRYATAAATLGPERGVALLVVVASFLAQAGVTRLLGLWGF